MKNYQIIILAFFSLLTISLSSHYDASDNLLSNKDENIDEKYWITWEIHDGFSTSEEIIIKNALQILVNRLFSDRIRQNMYEILGTGGYNIEGGVWECSKLNNDWKYSNKYEELLGWQILQLGVKGRHKNFPKINIHPYHKQEDVWARAPLSTVTLTSTNGGTHFTTKGEFEVKLNKWMLGASIKGGKDSEFWASVLAHEMLHNLGHDHNLYNYNLWQINVFEKCLYWNGNYNSSMDCIDWSCGMW